MATVIVKTNVLQGSSVLIKDVGVSIPASGGSETFTNTDEISQLQLSRDLRDYLIDDAYGVGSSTLILNDGTSDLAQTDALNFLATVQLPDGDQDYGVIKTDAVGEVSTDITFDGIATVTNLIAGNAIDAGSFKIVNLQAGVAATDAVNVSQLQAAVTEGKVWKEVVLISQQLDSVNDALSQAIPFYLDGQPTIGDTFIITDGSTTETFTFVAVEALAFDVGIGGSTDLTLANLAQAITDDSTLWSAMLSSTLESLNDGSGTSTAGKVVVIYRTDQSAADTYPDRIYGSLTTAAYGQYVNFFGEYDYAKTTSSTLPSADPAQKQFGFGRSTVSLIPGETHIALDPDRPYTWDADDDLWNLSQGDVPAAGAGMTYNIGTNTYDVGAGAGILVNANDVEVVYGVVGEIGSLASAANAGVLDKAARVDHQHIHGDRGVDGAISEHDAQQIDVTGSYPNIGSPTDVEEALSNINDALGDGAKAGKWINFGTASGVPSTGTRFLETAGDVVGSSAPLRMLRAGSLSGASIQVNVVDASRAYKLSVQKNGTEVHLLSLPTSTLGNSTVAFTVTYAANDLIRCAMVRTSGSGSSTFQDVAVLLEVVDD